MAKYRGTSKITSKITPTIPFKADLSEAYKDVDKFIRDVNKEQILNIDADISAAEGRVKRFLKTKDSSMDLSIDINKKLLKDTLADIQTLVKGAAGALASGDNGKYDQLRDTIASFTSEFEGLSAVINGRTISGIANIVSDIKELGAVSEMSFDHMISDRAVKNSEQMLEHTKKTAKEIKKMQNASDPFRVIKAINRRANSNDITGDNVTRLQTRRGKLLDDQVMLSQLIQTDNNQLKIACEEAQKIVEQALKEVEARIASVQHAAQSGERTMKDFMQLWNRASKNHSAEDFGNRYSKLMEAITGDNPSMSVTDAYRELERREKAYEKQIEAERKQREVIGQEMQTLMASMPSLQEDYKDNPRFFEEYVRVLSKVSEGSLTAVTATEELRKALAGIQDQVGANQPMTPNDDLASMEARYKNILQLVVKWQALSAKIASFSGKNKTDLRKKILAELGSISPELANMIGDNFAQEIANGFKNIKTRDILSMVDWVRNADYLGTVTQVLNVLRDIDLSNIDMSAVNNLLPQETFFPPLKEARELLTQIYNKRKEQLVLTEAQVKAQNKIVEADQVVDTQVQGAQEETKAIEVNTAALEKNAKTRKKIAGLIQRYNSLIKGYTGVDEETIQHNSPVTSDWKVQDIIKNLSSWRGLYYDEYGETDQNRLRDSDDPNERKQWRSEVGKFERLIKAFEPYADDDELAINYLPQIKSETNAIEDKTEAIKKQTSAIESNTQAQKENLGYHAGDLGKAESYGQQSHGRRGTGHFGTGTYFVGNPKQIEGYNSRDGVPAPVERVDFSKYNLFRPETTDQAHKLHRALAMIDYDLINIHKFDGVDLNLLDQALVDEDYSVITDFINKYLEQHERDKYMQDVRQHMDHIAMQDEASIRREVESDYMSFSDFMGDDGSLSDDILALDDFIDDEVARRMSEIRETLANFNPELELAKRVAAAISDDDFSNIREVQSLKNDMVDELSGVIVGRTRDEISSALDHAFSVISQYPESDFYKVDSAATVFMKALGYEGIDTRHTGLDNTEYGSVIYDLKDEDLARRQEIIRLANESAAATQRETEAVKENTQAKEQASKQQVASARLTQIQRKAYNYRRNTDNASAISNRQNILSGDLSEVEIIKAEFPDLAKKCDITEKAIAETLEGLRQVAKATDSIGNDTTDMLDQIADHIEQERKDVEQSADALAAARKGMAQGSAYEADLYSGSRLPLSNVTYDPSKGDGLRNLGNALYMTPDLDLAAEYGENIISKHVALKNVFMLIEDGITNISDLYAAMGMAAPENANWESVTTALNSFLSTQSNIANFTRRMQEIGYDGIYAKGYGYADKNAEQLAIFDQQYWQELTTVPLQELKAATSEVQDSIELITTPSGQTAMFEGMKDSIEEVTDAAKELGNVMEEVVKIPGQISFDEWRKLVYHAGDLSNVDNTLKSFPLGNVPPRKGDGVGGISGLTGLYTTEDVAGFWGNEWHGAPISTIDISKYKLLSANTNEIADKVGAFLDDLNAAIYGYYDALDEKDWTLVRHTDVKSIDELYIAHKELFSKSNLTIEQFTQFIQASTAKIAEKSFADIDLPAIDEGVAKSGISSALQDVSDELFNSDSFKTMFLKMLGYEGVDVRGTKYHGTYTGGTVLFDVKKDSLRTVNEKWSDVMSRSGYEISEDDLKYEEQRRQLAFQTAKEYSRIASQSEAINDTTSEQADRAQEFLSTERQITEEKRKQLVAMHGIPSANLKTALENGAFPSPSIAVTTPDVYAGGYGDATVVFKKSAIDPASNPANKIYGVDAYTPTYPSFGYELNEAELVKVSEQTGIAIDELRLACDRAYENIVDAVGTIGFASGIAEDLQNAYIEKRGLVIETKERDDSIQGRFHVNEEDFHNGVRDILARDGLTFDDIVNNSTVQQEYLEAVQKYISDFNSANAELIESYPRFKLDEDSLMSKLVHRIGLSQTNKSVYDEEKAIFEHDQAVIRGALKVVDVANLNNKRSELISANREDYKAFVRELLGSAMVKPNVRGANGQRFDKTPEGIAAAMSSYGGKNALYGKDPFMRLHVDEQSLIIAASKVYRSFEEAEADATRLQKDGTGTHTRLDSEYSIRAIANTIADANKVDFDDTFEQRFLQALDGNSTADDIKTALTNIGLTIDDQTVGIIADLVQKAQNVPTKYLEGKPQRALGLDEISFVSIPRGSNLRDLLQEKGINYVEHDPDDMMSREEALRIGMQQFDEAVTSVSMAQDKLSEANRQVTTQAESAAAANEQLAHSNQEVASTAMEITQKNDVADDTFETQSVREEVAEASKAIDAEKNLADAHREVAEASNRATEQVKEHVSDLKEQEIVLPNLTSSEYKAAFKGSPVEKLVNDFGIKGQDADSVRGVFDELARFSKVFASSAFDEMADTDKYTEPFNECLSKATRMVMEFGGTTIEADDSLRRFYDHMNGVQIRYFDEQTSEFGDNWGSIKSRFNKMLVKSGGIPADRLYQELVELFPDLFDADVINDTEQLQKILDVVGRARDLKRTNWKIKQPILDTDKEFVEDRVLSIQSDMYDNLLQLQDAAVRNEQQMADAVKDTNEAREDGVNITEQNVKGRKNKNQPSDSDEEILSIFDADIEEALAKLRTAFDNKTQLIDLTNVHTEGNLEKQISEMAQKILGDDTKLSLGSVVAQGDIARISLYNKELGVTISQVYQLKKVTEDAEKASLVHVPYADTYRHDVKASKAYTEAQQRKIASDNRWLVGQLSKLDTQERKYKHSNKTISGATQLINADDTTLAADADRTIDSLVAHIKDKIGSSMDGALTDTVRNEILNDLRILDNEIKVRQYEEHASTTMKPTALAEARKELEYTLQSLETKAKKNNVFAQMEADFVSLRKRLTDETVEDYVKTGTDVGKFVDSLRTTKAKLNAEISNEQLAKKEQQDYHNLLSIQDKLYASRKKLAKLQIEGETGSAAWQETHRITQALGEQYAAQLKLFGGTQKYNDAKERQVQLEEELSNFRKETEDKQFDSDVKSMYDEYIDLIKKINSIDNKMVDLSFKDKGTGLYSDVIARLQAQKNELNQSMESLDVRAQRIIYPDRPIDRNWDGATSFLEDAKVSALLTTEQIQEMNDALAQTNNIKFNFAAKLSDQIKPVVETILSLRELINRGLIDSPNVIRTIENIERGYGEKYLAFTASESPDKGTPKAAMDLMKYTSSINEIVSKLQKQANVEANYFAGKKQFANISTMGEYDSTSRDMDGISKSADKAKQKLEAFVRTFADGKAVITNFTTNANGISKIDFSVLDEGSKQFRTFSSEIGTISNRVYTYDTSMKNLRAGTDAANKSLQAISLVMARLNNIDGADNVVNELWSKMTSLRDKLNEVGDSNDSGLQTGLKNMALEADKSLKSVTKLEQQWAKTEEAISGGNLADFGKIDQSGNIYEQMLTRIKDNAEDATISNINFDESTSQLAYTLTYANGEVKDMSAQMDGLTGTVTAQVSKVGHLKTAWQEIGSSLGDVGKELFRYVGNMVDIGSIIQGLRQGFNVVLEIDTALTELRKVTDETDATYQRFLQNMSKTGAVVGSTVKDLTTSAADWARIGYSIEEAGKLAENTMVLMNVSEFDDVTAATDTLVSALQAFADNSMSADALSMKIIDVFNQIGKIIA